MTGRIVVGIDGSAESANALEWALSRARLGGEGLELVSAFSTTPALDFYGYTGTAGAPPVDWWAELAEQLLAAAGARVQEAAPGLSCTTTAVRGHAAIVLTEASESAAAVVVGRRGLGAAASALLGSVSNRLTVQARCPVVVVGAGELPSSGPVVVGVDDSPYGAHALGHAIAEAALRGTSVRAVAAYETPRPAFSVDEEMDTRLRVEGGSEAAHVIARSLAEVAGDASVEVAHVTVEARPAEAILSHAGDAQLVVVGSHGKGMVRRLLLGSVSREVLTEADVPVAVVGLPGG